jgi:MtN3 and saliva related transmembrane protein
MTLTELVGWSSTLVLLMTVGRQVQAEWKSKATAGLSRWLFVGQITASCGFAVYSLLLRNWVFLFSNVAMLGTAIAGEAIYIANRRRQRTSAGTSK